MKVVIAGVSKTGTTALFHKILSAMPSDTRQLFEPKRYVSKGEANSLAKIMIGTMPEADVETFAAFDKKVHIFRDPRDRMVSRILYTAYNRPGIWGDPAAVNALLELLRRKECDPLSVSVLEIAKFFSNFPGPDFYASLGNLEGGMRFFKNHKEYFPISYDDMIADRLGPLAEYLNLHLSLQIASDSPALRRVARSRSSGDWRSWFTQADVDHFRPMVGETVRMYGFSDDWSLSPNPKIDSVTCSQYVERILEQARNDNFRPLWRRIRSRIKRLVVRRK